MRFNLDAGAPLDLELTAGVLAGFTGRDREQRRAHLEELAAMGASVPSAVPSFYLVPPALLHQGDTMTVTHGWTSGEAELVLLLDGPNCWVTLGSDHTDRWAEQKDIGLSKLACPKVLAQRAWCLSEVAGHWDRLELRSWIRHEGCCVLYQKGTMASLLTPDELLPRIPFRDQPGACAVFTGTVPARDGIRFSGCFAAELHDPVRKMRISLSYRVDVLGILDGSCHR